MPFQAQKKSLTGPKSLSVKTKTSGLPMIALQSKNNYPCFITSLMLRIKSFCNVLYLAIQIFSSSIPLWRNDSPSYAFTHMTLDPLFGECLGYYCNKVAVAERIKDSHALYSPLLQN